MPGLALPDVQRLLKIILEKLLRDADIPGKGTQTLAAALLQLVSQQSNFH